MIFDEFLQLIRTRLPHDKNDDAYWAARYNELRGFSPEEIQKELPYLSIRSHANIYGVDLYNCQRQKINKFMLNATGDLVWGEY